MPEVALNWNNVQNELKGFVFKRVKDKALTEDIVHDVFLKVQGKIQQLKDTDKVFGWIYQITRNTIVDHYRKESKLLNPGEIDWESNPPNFNECVSGVIAELIPTLPDKYRIPLEMTEIQNMSQLDVAEKLNLTYSAAKTRVQRARQMLRDKIDEVLIVKTDGYGNVILCKDRKYGC
jgi:RNA polymerase sigma-70 factor, ECF subfamily